MKKVDIDECTQHCTKQQTQPCIAYGTFNLCIAYSSSEMQSKLRFQAGYFKGIRSADVFTFACFQRTRCVDSLSIFSLTMPSPEVRPAHDGKSPRIDHVVVGAGPSSLVFLPGIRYYDDMTRCHACNGELALGRSIGRGEVCPACGADVRCCLNCAFYDRAAPKQCREPVAELVRDKARANFCDYFRVAESGTDSGQDAADAARRALDDLFRK